jgi:predicted protein tyrosine phosphatase
MTQRRLSTRKIPALSEDFEVFQRFAVPNPHLIAFVDHETLVGPEIRDESVPG